MKKNKIIIYLKLENKITKDFINLSLSFQKEGLDLIPMNIAEINNLPFNKNFVIMVVTNSFLTKDNLKIMRRRSLDYLFLNRKIKFIHLSSFGEITKYKNYNRMKTYLFLKLPLEFYQISQKVKDFYHAKEFKVLPWQDHF